MTRILLVLAFVAAAVFTGCAVNEPKQRQAKAAPEGLDFIEGVAVPPGGIIFEMVAGAAPQPCDPSVCDKPGDDTPQAGRGAQ
ncbi:MAG: hypothetical protein H6954_05315 [Chromatiaceae bacterium]|nr:hypothetical protein [Chromatiaceae bacterium]